MSFDGDLGMPGRHEIDPMAVHDQADGLDVVNFSGGMVAWERYGLPIATETGRPGGLPDVP